MKRSEAISKLQAKVISPHEIISNDLYESGVYRRRAENLLKFIEEELKMMPPRNSKKYNFHRHNSPFDYIDELHEWDEE